LNRNEARGFYKQTIHPSEDTARLRDKYLDEIDKTLEIKPTRDGVVLSRK
jgi:hypothetical protein